MFLGRQVAVYRITEFLGEGGFAYVYKARDENLEIDVALKVLKPAFAYDEVFEENFRKEAHRAAKFRHPNVVAIHYAGKDDDIVFFSMDLLPSGLIDLMKGGKLVEEKTIVKVGTDVASALQFAHTHEGGIVHRDLKPDNILFDRHGNAVVTDFGISEAATSYTAATGTTVYVGTPKYMSPEQARGQRVDHRSDIYSLGVTLYEMAAGAAPFTGRDWFELGRKHIEEEPPSIRQRNPKLNPELERIILRCLQKDPNHRYQRAENLRADLAAVGTGATTAAGISEAAKRPDSASGALAQVGAPREFHEATTQPLKKRGRSVTLFLIAVAMIAGTALAFDNNLGGLRTRAEEKLPALANLPYVGSGRVYATASPIYPIVEGGADVDMDLTIEFSGPLDPSSATGENVSVLAPGDVAIPAEVQLLPPGRRLRIRPTTRLAYETTYRISISSGLISAAGDPVLQNPRATEPGVEFAFRTRNLPPDTEPPSLTRSEPRSNTRNWPLDRPLALEFSEQMAPGTIDDGSVTLIGGLGDQVPIEILLSPDFTSVQVQPAASLEPASSYALTLAGEITDASGNRLQPTTVTFITAGGSDANPEPSRPAMLSVSVMPAEAMTLVTLEIDDKAMGNPPKLNVPIQANKRHIVKLYAQPPFSQHKLLVYEETIEPRSGQEIEIKQRVKPFGAITITSQPAADVFVDGQFVGSSPVASYPLLAGEHELELHPAVDTDRYSVYQTTFTMGNFERKTLGPINLPAR